MKTTTTLPTTLQTDWTKFLISWKLKEFIPTIENMKYENKLIHKYELRTSLLCITLYFYFDIVILRLSPILVDWLCNDLRSNSI